MGKTGCDRDWRCCCCTTLACGLGLVGTVGLAAVALGGLGGSGVIGTLRGFDTGTHPQVLLQTQSHRRI